MLRPFVITIDGPAGVGKSTLARKVARAFNIPMLDTGAMYRTLAYKIGVESMDMDDEKLEKKARALVFRLEGEGTDARLMCNDEEVESLPIRKERTSRIASVIAKSPIIRKVLQENQKAIAHNSSLLAEGRDMGTKVFNTAQCKIFLDASAEVRAKRRYNELLGKNEEPDFKTLFHDLVERDKQDRTREVDPLRPAEDAFIIDTSNDSLEEVFIKIEERVKEMMKSCEDTEESFTHLDSRGNACMVDVGDKKTSKRIAVVSCRVDVNANTLRLLKENALPKGDVLTTAKIAGILAAKQTSALIPMCHPIAITYVDIRFEVLESPPSIEIKAEVHTNDKTGVEMEALIAAQIAAATIYDMCKAVQKDISINECRLISKSGGKSDYTYTPAFLK